MYQQVTLGTMIWKRVKRMWTACFPCPRHFVLVTHLEVAHLYHIKQTRLSNRVAVLCKLPEIDSWREVKKHGSFPVWWRLCMRVGIGVQRRTNWSSFYAWDSGVAWHLKKMDQTGKRLCIFFKISGSWPDSSLFIWGSQQRWAVQASWM